MSRFPSARSISVFLGLVVCAAAAPAFSQVPISNANFSITFPAGWMKMPFLPSTDSSAIVLDTANEATALLFAAPHVGNVTAAQISAAMIGFGATDSLVVTAEGTKTLGGKSFSFIEWKKAVATGDEAEDRYRVYILTTGTFMFEGILGFNTENAASAVPDMESALATLNLTGGSTSLRAASASLRPASLRADRDVLGRQTRLPSGKSRPLPLYRAH